MQHPLLKGVAKEGLGGVAKERLGGVAKGKEGLRGMAKGKERLRASIPRAASICVMTVFGFYRKVCHTRWKGLGFG